MNTIWIVDAFTAKPYAGNPAGVMLVSEFPQDMPLIAAEMNLSETAFVKAISPQHFHIRWFTPKVEVKLCGHATLAAAHILFQENKVQGDKITFDSLSGPLLIYRESDGITLDFPLQKIGAALDKQPYLTAFNLQTIDEVVTAFDDVIVVLPSEADVINLVPHVEKIAQIDARGIIVTAPSTKYDFVSRFFAPRVGVNEDPVTGSSHCKLAHYWSMRLNKTELRAYQASQRGGEMHIKVLGSRVHLKGNAVTMMKGEWRVKINAG